MCVIPILRVASFLGYKLHKIVDFMLELIFVSFVRKDNQKKFEMEVKIPNAYRSHSKDISNIIKVKNWQRITFSTNPNRYYTYQRSEMGSSNHTYN